MSAAYADAFLRAVAKPVELGSFDVVHHCDLDFDAADGGRPDHDLAFICHEQDAFKVELFARFDGQAVHFDGPPFDGAVLLAAALNDCKSHFLFSSHSLRRAPAGVCIKPSPANGEAGSRCLSTYNRPSESYC